MVSLKIALEGMHCEGCAGRARRTLLGLKGVVKVITSLDDHSAEVTFDEHTVAHADLISALRDAGFAAPNEGAAGQPTP